MPEQNAPKVTSKGVVESLAWGIEGKVSYSLEGNINYSGAIIKWLVEDIKLIANAKESEVSCRLDPEH